jgi:hypothetical protein
MCVCILSEPLPFADWTILFIAGLETVRRAMQQCSSCAACAALHDPAVFELIMNIFLAFKRQVVREYAHCTFVFTCDNRGYLLCTHLPAL